MKIKFFKLLIIIYFIFYPEILVSKVGNNIILKIENERRLAIGLNTFVTYDELEEFNEKEDINSNNVINLKTDYQLLETANIMNDFLNLNKKTVLSSIE